MPKEGSLPPKERVNIKYEAETGGAQEEKELPLKLLMVGDYTLRPDPRPLEKREPLVIDKTNFDDVLREHELAITLNVPDRLSGEQGAEMAVELSFSSLKDFSPESVADQVPELQKLLDLRKALTALKAPLGNLRDFRKRLQDVLEDEESRERLLDELKATEPAP